jgi:hypothetical protein
VVYGTPTLCGVSSSYSYSSYATCSMLVHAYATLPGKAKWSRPHHTIKMLHFVLFHSVTCYTNSIVSCIHVNTTKLCNIIYTLVATCVTLWNLECSSHKCPRSCWAYRVSRDHSDSKSSRLHVDIFRCCFHSCEVYSSIDSSKVIDNSPEVSNFNQLFLELHQFIWN